MGGRPRSERARGVWWSGAAAAAAEAVGVATAKGGRDGAEEDQGDGAEEGRLVSCSWL